MATGVLDVTNMSVAELGSINLGNVVDNITISDSMAAPSVTLTVPTEVSVLTISTAGPQGPAGAQNLYTQDTDPSNVPGEEWGIAEKGYVWIEVTI